MGDDAVSQSTYWFGKNLLVFLALLAIVVTAVWFTWDTYSSHDDLLIDKGNSTDPAPTGIKDKVDEKTKEALNKEIEIPPSLKFAAEILLRLEGNPLLQELIVIMMTWAILTIMLIAMIQLLSPFSPGPATSVGLLLSLIAGVLGVVKKIGEWFVTIGGFITENPIGSFLLAITLIAIISAPLFRLIVWARDKRERDKAKREAMEIGTNMGVMGMIRKAYEKIAESVSKKADQKDPTDYIS